MPDDEKMDAFIAREAKGYRADSRPPADAMWSRIEGDVGNAIRRGGRTSWSRPWPWLAVGAGLAATLVLGIAIGRRSANTNVGASSVAVATPPSASIDSAFEAGMRASTLGHFAQAEVFLTEVRADLSNGRHDPERSDRSRQLLARTRLIMATNTRRSASIEQLLQDLEVVLAGIAALPDSAGRRPSDARLLDERARVGEVLPRIRTILPSPSSVGGS